MRRAATALAAVLTCGLMLAACGEEEGIPEGGTDRGLEEETTPSPTTPPPLDAGSEDQPVDCFDVSPTAPGEYTVGEAGIVTLDAADGEFSVASVETEDGWTHEVEEEEGLRVEVRFRPTGDDDEDDPRDDDDFADASDSHEHLADSDDQEVLVLVVAQGPSADGTHPVAEVCTSIG